MPPRTVTRTPAVRLEGLEDRLAPAVVGYYDMSLGQGNSNQVLPIQQAGHTAVLLTDLSAADLAGIDVLFVQNPSNSAYGAEYLSRLTAIADFVASGKTLLLHDRYVDPAETILPGGAGLDIRRDFSDPNNVNLLPGSSGTLLVSGPGGVLTDSSLDGGGYSSHGYAVASSLPAGALQLLSNGNPARLVAFAYRFGSGYVYYSTIPLDYHLQWPGPFRNVYAVNVVAFGVDLLNVPPVAVSSAVSTDEDSSVTGTLGGSDADGDPLTFEIVDGPTQGTVILDPATGVYRYTPLPNYYGGDSFTFRVHDGRDVSALASVTITVRPVNDAPVVAAGDDLSVDEGQAFSVSAIGWDVDGDELSYTWDFGDGTTATGPTATHTYRDNGSYTVTVTADDGNGGVTSDTLVVTVNNVAPQGVDIGPDRTVLVHQPASFTASFTDPGSADTHTLSWVVVNAAGEVVGQGTGASFTFTPPRAGTFTVTLTVTDDDGASASDSAVLTAPPTGRPTAQIAGLASAVRGQRRDFAASGTGFTGDVTGEWQVLDARGRVVGRGRGTRFRFTAAVEGDYRVQVTLRDAAGNSATAEQALRVNVVELQPDPLDPTKTALAVGGSNSRDVVVFGPGQEPGTVEVFLGLRSLGTFAPTGRLLAFGQDGNDALLVDPRLMLPSVLKGGPGDDVLVGGSGPDILQGGDGNDVLFGGAGRDLLIGGKGRDFLRGGEGDDVLVAGWTKHGSDLAALGALSAEWNSPRAFAVRVGNVTGKTPTADRLNGSVYLVQKGKGVTVFGWQGDDLNGEGGSDLLLGRP